MQIFDLVSLFLKPKILWLIHAAANIFVAVNIENFAIKKHSFILWRSELIKKIHWIVIKSNEVKLKNSLQSFIDKLIFFLFRLIIFAEAKSENTISAYIQVRKARKKASTQFIWKSKYQHHIMTFLSGKEKEETATSESKTGNYARRTVCTDMKRNEMI